MMAGNPFLIRPAMRVIFSLIVLSLLAACGPSYETDVKLTPPPTSTGQDCTTQCMKAQSDCNDACAAGQQQCETRARLQDDFDSSLYGSTGVGAGFPRPGFGTGIGLGYGDSLRSYQLCQPTDCQSRCAEHMYECYAACGGKVNRTTKCVKNCPDTAVR